MAAAVLEVTNSFSEYVHATPTEMLPSGEYVCLADYICAWFRYGGGLDICGSFADLQLASQFIVHKWAYLPSGVLDYIAEGGTRIERSVTRFLPYRINPWHEILDPAFFARCVDEAKAKRQS
jgi:hypothetical protein